MVRSGANFGKIRTFGRHSALCGVLPSRRPCAEITKRADIAAPWQRRAGAMSAGMTIRADIATKSLRRAGAMSAERPAAILKALLIPLFPPTKMAILGLF